MPEPPHITAITTLPSDPNVRSIRVDNRVVARLTATEIEQLGLKHDLPWTEEIARQVDEMIIHQKARKVALGMLARRSYSRGEFIERLIRREVDPTLAERIATELENDGWLDDRAYGEALAAEMIRKQPASPSLIVKKLVARQIDPILAASIAAEISSEQNPTEQATILAEMKLKQCANLPREKALRRVAGALMRRGFDEEMIEEVVGRME